jgi:hypothetical protein
MPSVIAADPENSPQNVILSEAKDLLLMAKSRFFGLRPQNDKHLERGLTCAS